MVLSLLGPGGLAEAAPAAAVDPATVRKVHLVFSNHFDAGFADYASNILNRYVTGGPGTLGPPHPRNETVHYDSFLLSAAATASALRAKNVSRGAPRFRYMTHAYIASYFADCTTEYPRVGLGNPLRCPNASQLAVFADAVARGDIFWHAFPHNAEPELMDTSFFGWAIDFTQQLAARFKSPTIPKVMSQRDVPGLSRGAIPTLVKHGVIGISVGVNDGSPAPILPSTAMCYSGERQIRTPFVWKDVATGTSVVADFHPGGYGGVLPINPDEGVPFYSRDGVLCDCVGVQGLDEVLCYTWKGDNYGGANVTQTEHNFDIFYHTFPNAEEVVASSLGQFWALLEDHKDKMEIVTSEIGDTWMYGASSDPLKLATMRYMMRARRSLDSGVGLGVAGGPQGQDGDRHSRERGYVDNGLTEFNRLLLKLPEHTWGSCGSAHMHVTKPTDDWTSDALEAAINQGQDPFFAVVQASWDEQRQFMTKARSAVPASSPLGPLLDKEQATLSAPAPTAAALAADGFEPQPKDRWDETFSFPSAGIDVRFDEATGALVGLTNHKTGTVWAASSPMFRFTYRSHSYAEAEAYAAVYKYSHGGKFPHVEPNGVPWPGMNDTTTTAKNWHAAITGVWRGPTCIVIETAMPKDPKDLGYGPPTKVWFRYTFSASRMVDLELVWEGKRPTRLRESIWLEMRPDFDPSLAWTLFVDKTGQKVNTSDVVKLGGAALHGMDPTGGVVFQGSPVAPAALANSTLLTSPSRERALVVKSLDCGLVAPGSNFNIWNITAYDTVPVDARDGLAFDLYSNLYAVNYPMWYPWVAQDATSRFRFQISEV
jgi:hypothetical protein